MPAEDDDWRLQNQREYLQGQILHWSIWTSPRPEWDHDHCAFCWAKFMDQDSPDVLHAGYTTADGYYWICQACFEDFRDRLQWKLDLSS